MTMQSQDYYREQKWCESCNDYVPYLMSVNHSFCVECGGKVKLFSKTDKAQFSDEVQKRKWKAV